MSKFLKTSASSCARSSQLGMEDLTLVRIEAERARLIAKGDDQVQFPRSMPSRVHTLAGVV